MAKRDCKGSAVPGLTSTPRRRMLAAKSPREGPMPQQLRVYQSLWAMERRRPDKQEWSRDQQLAMIRDAGYDGCGVRFVEREEAAHVTKFLRAHNMTWQAQCYPKSIDGL